MKSRHICIRCLKSVLVGYEKLHFWGYGPYTLLGIFGASYGHQKYVTLSIYKWKVLSGFYSVFSSACSVFPCAC